MSDHNDHCVGLKLVQPPSLQKWSPKVLQARTSKIESSLAMPSDNINLKTEVGEDRKSHQRNNPAKPHIEALAMLLCPCSTRLNFFLTSFMLFRSIARFA